MYLQSLIVALAAVVAIQAYPPAFPRLNATNLRDTSRYTVWDIVWPKGQPTAMHRHVNDQVGTYYQKGDRKITSLDGSVRTASTEVGAISNTRKDTTHIEEGTSDTPLRAVFIELKHDAPSGAAAVTSDRPPMFPRQGASKVRDDERVAVWDYTWTPSAGAFEFVTRHETVVVALTTGRIRAGKPSAETTIDLTPGQTRFLPAGTVETDRAVEGQPRMIVFELK